ncbi:Crp/Fnr family transcriptional regulator [Ahrensia sp. 13_GOM-1096m]|uniref:Crp/Fnr family transcriptional regulator n=1 Tax=Ahrensia sp. 13_GOM-1096m TaxID=1380380 RepID=UPI00047E1258|nr:Crp/Fnr family transcriptional regulator [Ahrensia sp. 13_GOM-1096m]
MELLQSLKASSLKSLKRIEFRKKETLLHQGDVSKHAYVVQEGCLRLWHNNDGTDITVQFFLPGEIVASLDSFIHATPSNFSIEAVTFTVVNAMDKASYDSLIDQSPEFGSFMFKGMVKRVADYQNLFLNRIMENPENRYRHLIEQDPELFEIVPQHYIASYLGVTPVSLSRIRKKVGKC